MSSKDIIRTTEEAENANCGLVYNLHSSHKAVEIEDGFNLYQAIYDRPGCPNDGWWFIYASKSDESAIETAFKKEPSRLRCIYVDRLILREDDEPSSIIIWGD